MPSASCASSLVSYSSKLRTIAPGGGGKGCADGVGEAISSKEGSEGTSAGLGRGTIVPLVVVDEASSLGALLVVGGPEATPGPVESSATIIGALSTVTDCAAAGAMGPSSALTRTMSGIIRLRFIRLQKEKARKALTPSGPRVSAELLKPGVTRSASV